MNQQNKTINDQLIDLWVNKLIPSLESNLAKIYGHGKTKRFFHTKMHGCVRGEFIVNPDLPEHLRVGVFANQNTYKAWVRFSNAHHRVSSDEKKNFMGMAVKLMDVPGKKLLDLEEQKKTHDFLLVSVPVLNARSLKNTGQAIMALGGNIFKKLWFAITHIGEVLKALKPSPHSNLIYSQFWSLTPYAFGDRVVKYSIIPRKTEDPDTLHHHGQNYLRKQLAIELAEEEAWFDFAIQFQEDPATMPLEDPSVKWSSTFHKVASIKILKQEFDNESHDLFGENLSFNPWHSIEEHRPLGKINEARKYIYKALSKFRHTRNTMKVFEPEKDMDPEAVYDMGLPTSEIIDMFPTGIKTYQSQFTAIIPIIETQQNNLNDYLIEQGQKIKETEESIFSRLRTVHFCRFFIINEAKNPDGGKVPPHLVFSAVYDGKLEYFLNELFDEIKDEMEIILGNCIGYPKLEGKEERIKWFGSYRNKEKLFWASKKGATVSMIRKESELQKAIQEYLDKSYQKEDFKHLSPREIYGQVRDMVENNDQLKWALIPEPSTSIGTRIKDEANKIFVIFVILILILPVLLIWTPLTILFNTLDRKKYQAPDLKPLNEVLEMEDKFYENQLTIYATIKIPGWFRRNNLKLFLFVANNSMRYRATKGSLGGISSIHFVSWSMFNKNRNGMFLSNYDNGWQSYLSEFIDKAANIMNRSFGNLKGYPPIRGLNKDGAYDEQKFKEIVRQYQFPCPIWYSAYPQIGVSNVLFNSKIRQGLAHKMSDSQIKIWLELF